MESANIIQSHGVCRSVIAVSLTSTSIFSLKMTTVDISGSWMLFDWLEIAVLTIRVYPQHSVIQVSADLFSSLHYLCAFFRLACHEVR